MTRAIAWLRLGGFAGVTFALLSGCGSSSSPAKATPPGTPSGSNDGGTSTTQVTGETDGGGSQAKPSPDGGAAAPACAAATNPPIDVVDSSGNIVAANYQMIAKDFAAADGIRYRFGEDATCYHPDGLATSTIYQAPDRTCLYSGGFLYQVGPDQCSADPGDYSSDEGVALIVADDPTKGGVNQFGILDESYDTYQSKPQTEWAWGNSVIPGQMTSTTWTTMNGGPITSPIAAARAFSNGEDDLNALVVFQSGFIGAFGENTSGEENSATLPSGLVPTSIAITAGSEFALVTTWDTRAMTGAIAVFALTSCEGGTGTFCNGGSGLIAGNYTQHQAYPGFANAGDYSGIKYLGLVPLPDMKAPTEIAAYSNYSSGWWTIKGSNTSPPNMDFTVEADRATFEAGGENAEKYSRAGYAIVISKSEKKASFVNLQPLFAYYASMYFTTPANFTATRSLGTGPHDWPYTFADTPSQMPTVVTTVTLPEPPTAVAAGFAQTNDPAKGYGALVATRDGTLHIYGMGGLIDGTSAKASDVTDLGTVAIGQNPTHIAHRKANAWGTTDPVSGNMSNVTNTEVMIVSRGDREIEWVSISGGSGKIYKRLSDALMIDPIFAEDADNHGTESYLLTVADYAGRQVLNYRYGPVIFHTNDGKTYGMGADGTADFERGGAFAIEGAPFMVSGANVP